MSIVGLVFFLSIIFAFLSFCWVVVGCGITYLTVSQNGTIPVKRWKYILAGVMGPFMILYTIWYACKKTYDRIQEYGGLKAWLNEEIR